MHFSSKFAIIFILAGLSAGVYFIKNGKSNKNIPLLGLALCSIYTLSSYDISYTFLTIIEYAIGFGLSFAFFENKQESNSEIIEKNEQ